MGFSRTEPMYYLREHRGVKAGTPVGRVKASQLSRLRLLAAHGVIGTKADASDPIKTQPEDIKPEATPEVPEVVKAEETPEAAEEVKEEAPEAEESTVSVEVQEKPKSRKKKSKR